MSRLSKVLVKPSHDPLHAYQLQRNFTLTSELATGGQPIADQLPFVVQKHWASSLHYDLRLELDGAMKSWAMQVENNPLAYADFEGRIPAKQYGAGQVIVWDAGTWLPLQDPAARVFRDGNLKFELHDRCKISRSTWRR